MQGARAREVDVREGLLAGQFGDGGSTAGTGKGYIPKSFR